jgi:hypothetical protein
MESSYERLGTTVLVFAILSGRVVCVIAEVLIVSWTTVVMVRPLRIWTRLTVLALGDIIQSVKEGERIECHCEILQINVLRGRINRDGISGPWFCGCCLFWDVCRFV